MRLLGGLNELILRKTAWLTANTIRIIMLVTGLFSGPPLMAEATAGLAEAPPGPGVC